MNFAIYNTLSTLSKIPKKCRLNRWIQLTYLLVAPNSDLVMFHLGGYNSSVCTHSNAISCLWQIAQL